MAVQPMPYQGAQRGEESNDRLTTTIHYHMESPPWGGAKRPPNPCCNQTGKQGVGGVLNGCDCFKHICKYSKKISSAINGARKQTQNIFSRKMSRF